MTVAVWPGSRSARQNPGELDDRSRHRGIHVGHIELHCLGANSVAGIGDVDADLDNVGGIHISSGQVQVRVFEAGVGEAVPEG